MNTLNETVRLLEAAIEANGFETKSFVAGYVLNMGTAQLIKLYTEIMEAYAYSENLQYSVVVITHLRRELG